MKALSCSFKVSLGGPFRGIFETSFVGIFQANIKAVFQAFLRPFCGQFFELFCGQFCKQLCVQIADGKELFSRSSNCYILTNFDGTEHIRY